MGSKKKIALKTATDIATSLLSNEKVQKFLCGEYSDGSPRSLPDALSDELYSPKQKGKLNKKKKNKKKKNKKKHNKKIYYDYYEF